MNDMRKWAVGLSLLGALSAPGMFMAPPVQAASESANSARTQAVASAELMMQMEQLKVETQSLRDMVERQQRVIQRLEDNQRNRYVDTDQRLQTLREKLDRFEELLPSLKSGDGSARSDERSDTPDSGQAETGASRASSEEAPDEADTTSHDSSGSAQADYTAAYALVQKKQFDAAIDAFQTFIREHPDTRLLGNAYYWIGEIYMAQNRSSEAQKMFEAVINEHPDSYKVPDSMYKLALIQARFGNESKAEANMQSILDQYAQSNAAKLANTWLESKSAASSQPE